MYTPLYFDLNNGYINGRFVESNRILTMEDKDLDENVNEFWSRKS